MISSPKLKFNTSARRAFFLSADKLAVYHWNKGKLGSSYLFDATKEGQEYFARYLKETPNNPAYFLVDIVEEGYRQDTIPHVYGADRQALINRKKSRLFRDTPYFYADLQGREEEGRRDDRALFMALTNPGILAPWLKLLNDNEVPLAGICSLPQLTRDILDIIPEPADHMLVVSQQSISGLRQSFFYKKDLKISRLVGLPRYGTEPYAPYIYDEIEKIRRYLDSLNLVPAENPLDIYILANSELLNDLEKLYISTAVLRYHPIDINLLANKAGLGRDLTTPFCDQLLMYYFLKRRPANYYASATETRYFKMHNMRRMMLAASIFMFLGGIIWGSLNFWGGISYKQQALTSEKKSEFYSARYEIAREKLPKIPVEPADLKIAVEIARTLNEHKAVPFDMLKLISFGMRQFPSIQVDEINWEASVDPNTNSGQPDTSDTNQMALGLSNIGTSENYQYYQIASMQGHISSFDGNYRKALEIIDKFAEVLRNKQSVHDVSIVTLPLNIDSDTSLQGAADSGPGDANFSIRIVLGVNREA